MNLMTAAGYVLREHLFDDAELRWFLGLHSDNKSALIREWTNREPRLADLMAYHAAARVLATTT